MPDSDSILAVLPDGVVGIDRSQRIAFVNRAAESIFGHASAEIIGHPLDLLLPSRCRARHSSFASSFLGSTQHSKLMHERRPVEGMRRDGTTFPAEVTLVKGRDGMRALTFAIIRDVSEEQRRQAELEASERRTRAIIAASPAPIIVVDTSPWRVVEANAAAATLFRYGREELVGRDPTVILSTPHKERFKRLLESAKTGAVPAQDSVIRTADGSDVAVEISMSPAMLDGGSEVVAFFHDKTEQIARERRLRQALDAAEASVKSKRVFLANMSHELRTPLNAIIGFAELIEREFHGPHTHPSYREYGQLIRASGEHLLSIVNDVLDLSSLELGKVPLHDEIVPISEVAAELERMLAPTLEKAGVKLVISLPGDFCVLADRRALKQMLLNLLGNALKFTEPGGRVFLTGDVEAAGPIIAVADTGRGIPPERLPHITEPFRSEESGYHRKTSGAGIGLSITKGLVESHGGHIEIDSTLGVGTTVRLCFPAERAV